MDMVVLKIILPDQERIVLLFCILEQTIGQGEAEQLELLLRSYIFFIKIQGLHLHKTLPSPYDVWEGGSFPIRGSCWHVGKF